MNRGDKCGACGGFYHQDCRHWPKCTPVNDDAELEALKATAKELKDTKITRQDKLKELRDEVQSVHTQLETENARLTKERDEARAATYVEVVRAKAMVARIEALEGAVVLLCDELEISMPDKPQEFNGESIWGAYRKIKALTPASGKEAIAAD